MTPGHYMNMNDSRSTPLIPLPNPGEGGPVFPGSPEMPENNQPVPPLPDIGEGGPAFPGDNTPVIPLPNPGEGGAVFPGGVLPPIWPRYARVRFLNAAFNYRPFRILINRRRVVNWLSYASRSAYGRVPEGYQTITVTGADGFIYIQKALPFQAGQSSTIAIINTPGGLDLLQISDNCCAPSGGFSNFRVSNLARNSGPMDVLLGDGRVVYGDIRFKETTSFKRIRPGAYQFYFAETALAPMPEWIDIETVDNAFIGTYPVPNTLASLYLNVGRGVNCTAYLLTGSTAPNAVQAMVVEDR